jgi:competence protein ComEC
LLTGDIDAAAERVLIDSGFDVRARWLQAPHHGSRTSSSMVFLKAVKPEGVLISRGRNNTFGHPHPRVMARFAALAVQPYDSAELGAIRLQLGRHDQPQAERGRRRFWRE